MTDHEEDILHSLCDAAENSLFTLLKFMAKHDMPWLTMSAKNGRNVYDVIITRKVTK